MDHDPRVRKGVPLAFPPGGEQQRGHGRGLADADRVDRMLEVLHGVVDRQARGHDAARRVDVQEAVALGVLGLEEEQLGDDEVRHRVLDGVPDEDDPLLEEAREDVVGALAAPGLLDDHRHEIHRRHRSTPSRMFILLARFLFPVYPPVGPSRGLGGVGRLKFLGGRGEMRRFPRSLVLYVAASTIYAAIIFLAVHAVYGVELGRAGLRLPDPEAFISSIDSVSFMVWLGISLIAGVVLYRLAMALEVSRGDSAVRDAEIGSIFALSQALSGSLDLAEIARAYLRSARRGLDASATLGVLVHDDIADAFRLVAEEGPHARAPLGTVYSVSGL